MIGHLFTACALATLPGTLELAALTLSGLRGPRMPRGPRKPTRPEGLRVVMCAHDEEVGLGDTLDHVLERLPEGADARSVLVVADNCTDETAAVARSKGVRVIERVVKRQRGKGRALEEAFEQLLAHDPGAEFFVVLDADARLGPNALIELLLALEAGAPAVQASYRVADPDSSPRAATLNLAWLCFNHLRPLGRERLGLSAGLLGNGFGLTRDTLALVPYRAGSVVEDLEYHLRLVAAGLRVRFVAQARVLAAAPPSDEAARRQRVRWEGGRLRMAKQHLPRLLGSVLRGRLRALEPALDLMLLPLALHTVLLGLGVVGGGLGAVVGLAGLGVLTGHVLVAAHEGGRGWRDLEALGNGPRHVLDKLALVPRIVRGASSRAPWTRTDRAA